MISYIIIEDNHATISMLTEMVSTHFKDSIFLGKATNVKDGIHILQTNTPNFIFLDINLEDGEGFEILKHFPTPVFKVIFITSYSKYAMEAFKFSALDFVLKPFTSNDIICAVNKVIEHTNVQEYTEKLKTFFHNYSSPQKKIILSDNDNIYVVKVEDILYAKSDNSYTTFYILDGTEILVSKSLKSFEEKLSPYLFLRIHQKHLINLQHIIRYDKRNNEVVLTNNVSLPTSRAKKEQLTQFLKGH